MLYPAWYGALTQLWAGTTPEAADLNGKVSAQVVTLAFDIITYCDHVVSIEPLQWLIPWARIGDPNRKTQDPETGRKLWRWLEENTKST